MILRLMDHLKIAKATFVGHDTGGGVALILGIDHPSEFTDWCFQTWFATTRGRLTT